MYAGTSSVGPDNDLLFSDPFPDPFPDQAPILAKIYDTEVCI